MPIRNRIAPIDPASVKLKRVGSYSYDIYVRREEAGSIDYTTERLTKSEFLYDHEGLPFLKRLFGTVPEDFVFNHYYLDEIILWSHFRGTGIGGVALQLWMTTLKHPACVTLTPAKIGNVSYQSLLRFYRKNGFKLFKEGNYWTAITFIKAK